MRALELTSSAIEMVICVSNEGYKLALKPWRAYEVVPDERLRSDYIRVIDETGEDYVYPADYFVSAKEIEPGLEELRCLRKLKGLSQQDLAAQAGVSQYTITEIETGRRDPRPSTLRKLADALDVEVADFSGRWEKGIEELKLENARLRAELWEQWLDNHSERCTNEWPHPDKEICTCPLPSVLRVVLHEGVRVGYSVEGEDQPGCCGNCCGNWKKPLEIG